MPDVRLESDGPDFTDFLVFAKSKSDTRRAQF
jgi:hypothetical protein